MRAVLKAALGLAALVSAATLTTSATGRTPEAADSKAQAAKPRAPVPPARAGAAPERADAAAPFKVGETLSYDVSWSQFIVAGTATTTVVERKSSLGSTAYYMVVEGRPIPLVARLYPLYYKMDTLLDTASLLSQRGSFYAEERTKHRLSTTRFDRAKSHVLFEQKTDTTLNTEYAVPPQTQDGLAALYAIRARTLHPGDRITVPVADSGSLFTTAVVVAPPETVNVPLGRFNAWKMTLSIKDPDGQPVWRDIALWVTTDARRLPVKMQAELPVGAFVLALREAK